MLVVESLLQASGDILAVFAIFSGVILFLGVLFSDVFKEPEAVRSAKVLCVASLVFGFLGFFFSTTSSLWYEFPTNTGRLIAFRDGEIHQYRYGAFEWQDFMYVPKHYSYPTGSFRSLRSISSTVSPITDNPKVRHIEYRVVPEVFDMVVYLSDPDRRGLSKAEANQQLCRVVSRCLYDFNEDNSIEVSKFFNPLDDKQVEEFNRLVESWVNERLASEGVRVKSQGFSLLR